MRESWPKKRRAKPSTTRSLTLAAMLVGLSAAVPLALCELRFYRLGNTSPTDNNVVVAMTSAEFAKVLPRLDKQKDQRSDWAYGALVGIVAITVLKRVIQVPGLRQAYALLGSSGVLLLESIRAGDLYERHAANLVRAPIITDVVFKQINGLLWSQIVWLNVAVGLLIIFVLVFLTAAIAGRTRYVE